MLFSDEWFGTGPGFMELTKDDIDDMTFTRARKKILLKNISCGSQPVAMDTIPPSECNVSNSSQWSDRYVHILEIV